MKWGGGGGGHKRTAEALLPRYPVGSLRTGATLNKVRLPHPTPSAQHLAWFGMPGTNPHSSQQERRSVHQETETSTHSQQHLQSTRTRAFGACSAPTHRWTAVCCRGDERHRARRGQQGVPLRLLPAKHQGIGCVHPSEVRDGVPQGYSAAQTRVVQVLEERRETHNAGVQVDS